MSTELRQRAASSDTVFSPQQRQKMIEENLGLVGLVVRRFARSATDTEDLFQIGCVGLIKAVERFDLCYGVKLSTYAVPVIIGEIKRYLRDDGALRISRSVKTNAMHIAAYIEQTEKKTGQTPTITELANALSLSQEDVILAMDALRPLQYLQAEDTQSGLALMDTIAAPDTEQSLLDHLDLRQALCLLSPREQALMRLRYYEGKTQTEIAAHLGISQVQVSRLEKGALEQIRKQL